MNPAQLYAQFKKDTFQKTKSSVFKWNFFWIMRRAALHSVRNSRIPNIGHATRTVQTLVYLWWKYGSFVLTFICLVWSINQYILSISGAWMG